ncbi:MAG: hypothetical protein CML66_30220 [Rhodobacteraceae bacterium]|nr:hypothetical protein [Paracoccaceae bacterium]MAY44564.1 hypothetical protein [Paracoccaceae bacterium]QEW20683.1 biotin biosynthesis protein BioC [Marinibacterium anthonyi]
MEGNASRFDGLAEAYDAYRRPYPAAVFRDLAGEVPQGAHFAVDVGAGTGISTQGLLDHLPGAWMVIGVEPGNDMRRVLSRRLQGYPNFQANPSMAEAIRLPDACAGLVTAFTAVHWFDRAAFLAEARRLLVPGGVLGLARNRRKAEGAVAEIDGFLSSQSEMMRDMAKWERAKTPDPSELGQEHGFPNAVERVYPWAETVRTGDLLDLYLTRSVVVDVVRAIGLTAFRTRFEEICAAHHGHGAFELRWETVLLSARV